MAPHSSTLAWKIPRTEEPARLQSMGSLRVRHDWTTSLSLFTFLHWQVSSLTLAARMNLYTFELPILKMLCPHKNLDTNIHSSTCHPKSRINKMWSLHTKSNRSAIKRKWSTDTCYNEDEAWKHYAERKPDTKGRVVNDCIDMKSKGKSRDRK